MLDRSSLLLQGRREELLSGCNVNDRRYRFPADVSADS